MTSALNLGNPSFRSDQDGVTPYEGIWDGIVVTASGRARTLALRPVRSLRSTSTARYQVALHIRAHMHGGTVELRLTGWLNRTAGGGRHPVEAQPYLDSARPRFLRKLFSWPRAMPHQAATAVIAVLRGGFTCRNGPTEGGN